MWSDLGYLICLRHCLSSRAVTNQYFFIQKLHISLHTCAIYFELPSNICTVQTIIIMYLLSNKFLDTFVSFFFVVKKNVDFIIAKSALKFTCLFPVHLGMPYLWWLHMVFFTRLVQGRMVDVYPCAALALDHEIHRQYINNVHKVLSILKKSY